tara:strand:+ start:374 stop:574 length:201 start_codon:yes stop_codon:yes gene_type:complete
MSILNYFFIGAAFTLVIDLLLGMERIKTHPAVKDKNWGVRERIICIIVWPLSVVIFLTAFIRQFTK